MIRKYVAVSHTSGIFACTHCIYVLQERPAVVPLEHVFIAIFFFSQFCDCLFPLPLLVEMGLVIGIHSNKLVLQWYKMNWAS